MKLINFFLIVIFLTVCISLVVSNESSNKLVSRINYNTLTPKQKVALAILTILDRALDSKSIRYDNKIHETELDQKTSFIGDDYFGNDLGRFHGHYTIIYFG